MTGNPREPIAQTRWHRFLAKAFELSVGQEQIQVESELQTSSDPPKIDIVLLGRETPDWTPEQRAMLPDGVRDSAAQSILLEFKYSESLTQGAIVQAMAYEHFFRTNRGLKREEVQMFILCAKTPQPDRLVTFEYEPTDVPGIYRSHNIYSAHIPILVLNQLRDDPHNALVKAFASRQREKAKAFSLLRQFWTLSSELLLLLEVLQTVWSLPEGATMNEVLTLERVMEIGEEWKRIFLENLPAEELDAYVNPEYKQRVFKQGHQAGHGEGREEGREEGEKIAMGKTIEQILQRRFGDLPQPVRDLLQQCKLNQLNDLVNSALDATDLDDFCTHLPPANDEE